MIRISAKQTEGRLWSFEEFLLIDSDGVKSLSERQVTPAEVLLWSGPGPDGPRFGIGTAFGQSLPLGIVIRLSWKFFHLIKPFPVALILGLAPFRFPACDWAVAREGTEEERTLLPAYARAQQNLLQKIRETSGRDLLRRISGDLWERLTFTTFDLDPSRVLDLSFGTGEPHVWDGLWEGIHDPARLDSSAEALAWPPEWTRRGELNHWLPPDRKSNKLAGWSRCRWRPPPLFL
ncbi:MAG: hypothetical protein R3F31_07690 [Verrucomicrobiales bacterium]